MGTETFPGTNILMTRGQGLSKKECSELRQTLKVKDYNPGNRTMEECGDARHPGAIGKHLHFILNDTLNSEKELEKRS